MPQQIVQIVSAFKENKSPIYPL